MVGVDTRSDDFFDFLGDLDTFINLMTFGQDVTPQITDTASEDECDQDNDDDHDVFFAIFGIQIPKIGINLRAIEVEQFLAFNFFVLVDNFLFLLDFEAAPAETAAPAEAATATEAARFRTSPKTRLKITPTIA